MQTTDAVKWVVDYFVADNAVQSFQEQLEMYGSSAGKFLQRNVLIAFCSSVSAIAILSSLNTPVLYITYAALGAAAIGSLLHILFKCYIFERNKRQKEQLVADALLQASVFPRGTSSSTILSYLSSDDFGLLGKEFRRAMLEVERGTSFEQALENLRMRNKSNVIDRAILLLQQGYRSGADMSETFRETAADMLETNSILRERNAALVIEKYTLLFAGGLIVPAVLGLLAGLIAGFDFTALALVELGKSAAERQAMLSAVLLGSKIYIAEYALIASFFIANQEGNLKKGIIYAVFLLPCSLLSYFGARLLL